MLRTNPLAKWNKAWVSAILPALVVLLASCADPPPPLPVSPCSGVQAIKVGKGSYVVDSPRWAADTTNPDGSRVSLPADWIAAHEGMSILQPDLARQIDAHNEWVRINCPDAGMFKRSEPGSLPPAP